MTEEAQTLGQYYFDAAFSVADRGDNFGSPKVKYTTFTVPVRARLGVLSWADVGVTFRYVSQHLERGSDKLTGSSVGQVSPEFKLALSDRIGFLGIWHLRSGGNEDDLPIARGPDLEAVLLYQVPTAWPFHLNAGYVFREHYGSNLGIHDGTGVQVKPGNIFESRAALEIPLSDTFGLSTELAYYHVNEEKIAGEAVLGSAGEAMDALVGLVWHRGGWNMGLGAGFGLLKESHTSFDLERGAGDTLIKWTVAYKLKPMKPDL